MEGWSMKHPGTWLAIVDGHNARFVVHDIHGFHTFRSRASNTASPAAAEPVQSTPGRRCANPDPARAKRRFAALVAAELNNAAARHLFTHLILAGPSFALRWIEEALDASVRRRIVGRVIRGLMTVLDQDLPAYFPAWPRMR